MKHKNADYVVVGGGPAGSIAAARLAKDADVILFSEVKSRIHHCTGLISTNGLTRIGADSKEFVLSEIRGAKLVSANGTIVEVRGREKKARVVDRNAFDEYLRKKALDAGAELIEARALVGEKKTVKASDVEYNARRIILASGTDYTTHKRLNLDAPEKFLVGAQYDMKVDCDENMVEVYFNVPGFFSWVVPAGDCTKVGAAAAENPVPYLNSLVSKLEKEGRLRSKTIQLKTAGLIPVHKPSVRTQYDKLVLVGDACGHVKATTGGGVVYGGLAAKLAGEIDYESAWRKEIGAELKTHLMLRRLLDGIKPAALDKVFCALNENKQLLEEGGDMDSARKTVRALAKPGFALSLLKNAPAILHGLI